SNFKVKVWTTRASGGNLVSNPNFNAYIDYVKVTVVYKFSDSDYAMTLGGFGFAGLPADAVIKEIKTEVAWKSSAANSRSELGVQLFKNAALTSSISAETVDSSSPTALTTYTQTLTDPTVTAADLTDANFKARVRLSRLAGNPNPDFTASVDFV